MRLDGWLHHRARIVSGSLKGEEGIVVGVDPDYPDYLLLLMGEWCDPYRDASAPILRVREREIAPVFIRPFVSWALHEHKPRGEKP